MANPQDMPEVPDLEEFARKIDEAAASAEKFAESIGTTAGAPAASQQGAAAPMDMSVFRDILSALSMIHDDTTAIREALNQITES